MKHKILTFFLLSTLSSFLFVACSGASDPKETITVYTALEEEQYQAYLKIFREQHPNITPLIVRESTGVITERLLAEKDQPVADVVWGVAATSLLVLDEIGGLEPYAPVGLERVQNQFVDQQNTPPHWVGIDGYMSVFCVNVDKLAELDLPMPASWADLTNPVYQGHLVMPNPNSSGTGFLSVSAFLQLQGEEAGWDYMDALHENMAVYTHSGSQPCKMAGAGEYPIGISFGYRAIIQQESDAPITPVFPQEGSGWEMEANALIKQDNIKEGAKTFLDWAISDPVMVKYAENFPITSVLVNNPIPEGFPDDPTKQLIDNDFNWAASNRQAIINEWLARYDAKSAPRN